MVEIIILQENCGICTESRSSTFGITFEAYLKISSTFDAKFSNLIIDTMIRNPTSVFIDVDYDFYL